MTQPTEGRPVRRQLKAGGDAPAPAAPAPAPAATTNPYADEPDPKILWGWAAKAGRPWVGWAFIAFGLLVTLLGWIGVSGEAIVAKQIPYVVSGGIGGVLLAVIGAYFLGTEELRKDSGRLDRLEQKVDELHAALLQRADAPTAEVVVSSNGSTPDKVLVVSGGETFHGPGCPMAMGKDTEELPVSTATKRGLTPCPLCAPVPAS